MSHSGLLDASHSNPTISPAHHHANSSKMNGNAVQLSHRQHVPMSAVTSGILDSSKHSIGTVTGSTATPIHLNSNQNNVTINGSSPVPRIISPPKLSHRTIAPPVAPGVKHSLAALALMCVCSLFLSLVALIFLINIEPEKVKNRNFNLEDDSIVEHLGNYLISTDEFMTVYEVCLCLVMLVITLDLCCMFVCALQFLFAAKLLLATYGVERSNNYLHQSANNRVIAISAFFLSIPLFFTALILYTFIHFHATPAMVTSIVIGAAILFCGLTSIYNVYIWQSEKTKMFRASFASPRDNHYFPHVLDLTSTNMELSTLV